MATRTTKLAGPDAKNQYKVLSVKGHLSVRPGEIYTEDHVKRHLMRGTGPEVTIIEPKFGTSELDRTFLGGPAT